jgi:hypothetical protein
MPQLPPEYLDSATPPDVEVTDRVRLRYPDPTLGLAVPGAAEAAEGHPLVTVGDSLTHGMSSGAVFDTRLSWPAIVARSLRVNLSMPDYAGPLGGIPFNIEGLLRGLQDEFGDRQPAATRRPPHESRYLRLGRSRLPFLHSGSRRDPVGWLARARRPPRRRGWATTAASAR